MDNPNVKRVITYGEQLGCFNNIQELEKKIEEIYSKIIAINKQDGAFPNSQLQEIINKCSEIDILAKKHQSWSNEINKYSQYLEDNFRKMISDLPKPFGD